MRPPRGDYEQLLDKVLTRYYRAVKAFGWPPSVIDKESALVVQGLLTIEDVVAQMQADKQSRSLNGGPEPSQLRTGSMAG